MGLGTSFGLAEKVPATRERGREKMRKEQMLATSRYHSILGEVLATSPELIIIVYR